MPRRRAPAILLLLAALAAGLIVLRLAVGRDDGGVAWGFEHLNFRGVRAASGAIVGVCLALAGVMLQSMLRNALASPDIIGLASGAGLGVMLAAWLGFRAGMGLAAIDVAGLGVWGAALAGSIAALGLVYALSQRRGLIDPVTLVLVGVAVSIVCGAGTLLVKHLMPDQGQSAGRYLMGILRDDTPTSLLVAGGGAALAGLVLAWVAGPAMDAAALPDDEAASVGVPLRGLRATLFIAAGVLTAVAVIIAGPVAFVGLICPHVVRLAAGPSHRVLATGASLAGIALVVGCDVLVRALNLGSGQLPIGVLTSLVGAPVLITMLRRDRLG